MVATAQLSTSFRYEGRFQGPGITAGTMTAQTMTASIQRTDLCGGNLGLTTWTSAVVGFENGAFSISPTFSADALAAAMDPWNNFGAAACTVPNFSRQLVLSWNSETFAISLEDAPRATFAAYSKMASNSKSIGNVAVKAALACTDKQILRYNSVSSELECQTLVAGDIPVLTSANLPALGGGDVTGTYGNMLVAKIRNTNVSATAPTTNQVLKFDGSNWAPAADNAGPIYGDATYTTKGLVQINTDLATSGLSFTSGGILSLPDVGVGGGATYGSASLIPVISYDVKGRVTGVSTAAPNDASKLPLAGGTMTGPINMGTANMIHSVNKIGVKTSNPVNLVQIAGDDENSIVEIINSSSTVPRTVGFSVMNYVGAASNPITIRAHSSRGTGAAPTQTQAGDNIFEIRASGKDNATVSSFKVVARLSMVAEEISTATSSAGSIRLATTAVGTTTPQDRLTILPTGEVNVSATGSLTTPNIKVGGGTTVSGMTTCQTGAITAGALQTNAICTGITAASVCNCQWHVNPSLEAIKSVVPATGSLNIYFATNLTANTLAGSIRCMCLTP